MDYSEKYKKRNNIVTLNFEINVGYDAVNRTISYTTNCIPII